MFRLILILIVVALILALLVRRRKPPLPLLEELRPIDRNEPVAGLESGDESRDANPKLPDTIEDER